MTNQPDVSVIVPVYNVERYLPECIESLIKQTYKNIEIILVDDGSTDSSGKICDQYAETDKRIKVIHKKNERQHIARRAGLQVATAPYIIFSDADDYFTNDAIESLYANMKKYQSDMVYPAKEIFLYKKKAKEITTIPKIDAKIVFKDNFPMKMRALWGILYKREIITNAFNLIPAFKDHEDFPVFTYYLSQIKEISIINHPIYIYRQRKTSWAHSFINDKEGIVSLWKYYNHDLNLYIDQKDREYLRKILWNDSMKLISFSKNPRKEKREIESELGKFHINLGKSSKKGKIRNIIFFCNFFLLLKIIFCLYKIRQKNYLCD